LDGEDLRISMISESPPKKYGFDVFRLWFNWSNCWNCEVSNE
jgi:hypothetical protein